jgi:hypothetical protein
MFFIFYTRQGWLVPAIWLAAVYGAKQIVPGFVLQHFPGIPVRSASFLVGGMLAAPLVFLAGILLNRKKSERTVNLFGKDRVVVWGEHTLYTLPVEHWALIILGLSLVVCPIAMFL